MIKIHTYTEKDFDINKIIKLFKESFNQNLDDDYWKWRFLNNSSFSKTYITYAEYQNKIIAYYAVSPMFINDLNGEIKKIALSNMTMTHPDFQGQGLFTKLANKLFDELKKDGFIGVYGFANPNSHYGFRKRLNWKDIAILNMFKLEKNNFRNFLLKKSESLKIKQIDIEKFDLEELANYNNTSEKISIVINPRFFKWRFIDNPSNKYQILKIYLHSKETAIIVFKEYGNEIDIMEIFHHQKYKNDLSIIYGINWLLNQKSKSINIWSNLHTKEHLILEKFGFKETVFNTYFGIIPFTSLDNFFQLQNWHYRFTDSDIF